MSYPMKYDNILRGGRHGVYAAPRLAGPLRASAKRAGIAWLDLDLAGVHDRGAFLKACAKGFDFPGYFGHNWDALHECLVDAAGAGTPGAVVHWRRGAELARRSPDTVGTALEILGEAATYWGRSGRVFLVVVDRDCARGLDLPPLR
jgi:RNAse (barnase) inhibitor barstar